MTRSVTLPLVLAALTLAGCPDPSKNSNGPPQPAGPAGGDVPKEALTNPDLATAMAPPKFKVRFTTTQGDFVVEVERSWAPRGADRFYNLVKMGFFDGCRFFRVIDGFMAQFGINGDPAVNKAWSRATITDDPVKQSNQRGFLTFATAGPNTRTTQLFINFADNKNLDGMGFAPFGKVVEGMTVVDALYKEYGEGAPRGRGPRQDLLQSQGNTYLEASFPKLDAIKTAAVE